MYITYESLMLTLEDLREHFVKILDVNRGDGACALSLLDATIMNVEKAKEETEDIINEADELSEFSSDLAIEMLEEKIEQLTNRLRNAENHRQDSDIG